MRKSLSRIASAFQRKLFVRVCVASGTVIRPGDTLVLRTDQHLTEEQLAIVRANFAEKFPGVGFIRLSADSDIAFVCHPVANGGGNNGADGSGKQGDSQGMTEAPQSLEPSTQETKDADLQDDGLAKFVLDDSGSQADGAAGLYPVADHVKLLMGRLIRDAIVTDVRENGAIIQSIRRGL